MKRTVTVCSDTEQPGSIAAGDFLDGVLIETQLLDFADLQIVAHLSRIIGTQQNLIGAHLLDQKTHDRRAVRQTIDMYLPHQFLDRFSRAFGESRILPYCPAALQKRRGSTGMRETDFEFRTRFKHAAEDHAGDRHRGIHRIADQIVQRIFSQAILADQMTNRGMHEYQSTKPCSSLKERQQRRIVQTLTIDVGANLHGRKAALLKFLDRPRHILQWHVANCDEAIRIIACDFADGIVDHGRDVVADFRRCVVTE